MPEDAPSFTQRNISHYSDQAAHLSNFAWEETYEQLLRHIEEEVPFSLARYTDGEWSAIWKRDGCNIDGHRYYPEMGDALSSCLKSSPQYLLGVQWLIMYQSGKDVVQWLSDRDLAMQWVPGEILHEASQEMQLHRFVKALQKRCVIVVGNETLRQLPFQHEFVQVPFSDVWLFRERIIDDVLKQVRSTSGQHPVILYSASMAAEYMIDVVYREAGGTVTQIDAGSIWDPYLGNSTRRYHQGMSVDVDNLIHGQREVDAVP